MFGSKILDVAIGIIFLYILISIICSAIRESIEAWMKSRSAYLEYTIREMLYDSTGKGLADRFFNHPLIYSLYQGPYEPSNIPKEPSSGSKPPGILARGGSLPSYIQPSSFARTLMDLVAQPSDTAGAENAQRGSVISLDAIQSNIATLKNPKVERVLRMAVDSAQGDLNKAQANIEAWFDSAMERVSGQYKRSTHWIIFWIAMFVAVTLNVNTITIADYLYRNDAVRAAMVARAEQAAKEPAATSAQAPAETGGKTPYEKAMEDLDSIKLPIGWTDSDGKALLKLPATNRIEWLSDWLAQIFGWLLTAFAATQGAPFWFDLLNKAMVLRSTIKPKETAATEATATVTAVTTTAGQGAGGGSAAGAVTATASAQDEEIDFDGCDVDILDATPDEDLPAAEGGVA
ncbi:MAG: hypothetical protein ACKVX9_21585 [Blastocatellia bacterium]